MRTQLTAARSTSNVGLERQSKNISFNSTAQRRSARHETIVAVQVSGTFPGSPITLDYHFTIAHEKIASLIIDS